MRQSQTALKPETPCANLELHWRLRHPTARIWQLGWFEFEGASEVPGGGGWAFIASTITMPLLPSLRRVCAVQVSRTELDNHVDTAGAAH